MMSIRLKDGLVLEEVTGHLHSFGNGRHRHLAAPGPNDALPRGAVSDLFENLEDHNSGAFEGGLAVADSRVGDDVRPQFHGLGLAVGFLFHAVGSEFHLEAGGLQACGESAKENECYGKVERGSVGERVKWVKSLKRENGEALERENG